MAEGGIVSLSEQVSLNWLKMYTTVHDVILSSLFNLIHKNFFFIFFLRSFNFIHENLEERQTLELEIEQKPNRQISQDTETKQRMKTPANTFVLL